MYLEIGGINTFGHPVYYTVGTLPSKQSVTVSVGNGGSGSASITCAEGYGYTNSTNDDLTHGEAGTGNYYYDGTNITLNAPDAPTGFSWKGWARTNSTTATILYSNREQDIIVGSSSNTVNNATNSGTFYAIYTAATYNITYRDQNSDDTFSGTQAGAPTTHTYGTATTLKIPTREGYTFGGWFTAKNCASGAVGNTTAASLGATDYTGNITLYAKWTAKTYTVNLDNQSATTAGQTSVTATYDAAMPSIASNLPAKTNYVFDGYYSAQIGGIKYYNADGTSAHNWDIDVNPTTLYAHWIRLYTITIADYTGGTVTVSPDGGTPFTSGSQDIAEGTNITITASNAEHYTLTSLTYSDEGVISSGAEREVDGPHTVTAVFTGDSYDITYKDQGDAAFTGDHEDGYPTSHTYGTETTLKSATKTGYTFAGWYENPACTGDAVTTIGATAKTAAFTLYAKWTAVTYTITYNGLEGATNSNPATYTIETATITLANPGERAGYNFTGWTCGGNAITQIAVGSTGDKIITANWQVNSHTVTIASNNAEYGTVDKASISDVEDGEAITVSENTLTLNGTTVTATAKAEDGLFTYAFDGWTDNAGNALPSTVSGELTIRANFTRSTKTSITLNESGTDEYYTAFKSEYWGTEGEKAKTVTATYNRTFTQGRWSTLCLPFNVNQSIMNTQKLKGSVYEFKYATGDADEGDNVVLYFKTANTMNAGQCYIVNANSNLAAKTSFTFSKVTINLTNDNVASLTSADDYNSLRATPEVLTEGTIRLVGTLRNGTLKGETTGNTYMGLKDNKIWYPNPDAGNVIRAYRGLFRSTEALNASRVRIVVEGETVTELEVVNGEMVEATEAKKFVQDGILYIERDGVIYNAQGQKVGKVEN